jgi:hypothetical protein
MKDYSDPINVVKVSPEELAQVFSEYYGKKHSLLNEKVEASRYAVEVDFKTTADEANFGFAKIALGYVSSCLKKMGYHVKLVFTEKPLRVIVSSRNWDDGEWVGVISYNSQYNTFVLSKGNFNKSDKTVSLKSSQYMQKPFSGKNLSEKLKSVMDELKKEKNVKKPEIVINLKRGPKT